MSESDALMLQNFDIEIRSDGRWFHEGGEIKRMGLVKLFASVLSCDDEGRYWLTTPVEKGEIRVQDAPFIIRSVRREGRGAKQVLYLTDNIDQEHKISAATPLVMRKTQKGDAKPYILLEKGLSALIKHAVFYELVEIALEANNEANNEAGNEADEEALVLWSDGAAFALAPTDDQK